MSSGAILPTDFKVIEGATMLERAEKMLDTFRRKEVSGNRLVWRINDTD